MTATVNPRFVSYATPKYADEARQLRASAAAVGVPIEVFDIPDRGGWQKNTQYKCLFLREQLQLSEEPIVWLDADARIRQVPSILMGLPHVAPKVDLAVHYRVDKFGLRVGFDGELLSGTLYLGHSLQTFKLLDLWAELNDFNRDMWEQKNLQAAIPCIHDLNVVRLPAEYCMITTRDKVGMGTPEQAVIEHTQASRRLRS